MEQNGQRRNGLPLASQWLEHQTPDRNSWFDARCHQMPSEYVLVRSEVLWAEYRVQGTGEYFSPLQLHAEIVEVEIGGVTIYHPFGEFRRAKSYCNLYGAQGQRQAFF
ncbi:uncharacterized protein TNCV_1778121 [Trichonephila clavipes]|nr:uncharacterized protein TNCV_1778121 [Trichonephila clavipes]